MDHSFDLDSTFCSLVDKNKKPTPKKTSNMSSIKCISKEIHSHLDGKYLLDNSRITKYLQVVSKIKPRTIDGKKKITYLMHILNLIYKKNNIFTDTLLTSQELSTSQQHIIENFDLSDKLRIVEKYKNDLKSTNLVSEDLFSEDFTQNSSKTITIFSSNQTQTDITTEHINALKPSHSKYLDYDKSLSFNSSMLTNQNFISSNLSSSNKLEGLSLSLNDIHISDAVLESKSPKYTNNKRNLSTNKTISLLNKSNKIISKSLEFKNVRRATNDEILKEISKVITTFLNNKDVIGNNGRIIEYLMKNVNSGHPDVSKLRTAIKQLYNTQLGIVMCKPGDKSSSWEELAVATTQINRFNQQISSLFDTLESVKCEKDEQYYENLGKKVEKKLSTHLDSEGLHELNLEKYIQGSVLLCTQISRDFQKRFSISNVPQNTLANEELAGLSYLEWRID